MDIYKLDRIEGETAVLENSKGEFLNFALSLLPADVDEGDCFILKDEVFIKAENETARRRKTLFELLSAVITKKSENDLHKGGIENEQNSDS